MELTVALSMAASISAPGWNISASSAMAASASDSGSFVAGAGAGAGFRIVLPPLVVPDATGGLRGGGISIALPGAVDLRTRPGCSGAGLTGFLAAISASISSNAARASASLSAFLASAADAGASSLTPGSSLASTHSLRVARRRLSRYGMSPAGPRVPRCCSYA